MKAKKKFSPKDFDEIAEYICQTYSDRKKKRTDKEKDWKEVDRQIRMEPKSMLKYNADGVVDPARSWLPELEIPAQRQALEILTADVRRLMFPDAGPWFECRVDATDKYYRELVKNVRISGDDMDTPSEFNQDQVNELIESWLTSLHRQYDFRANMDLINAESLKYGLGVGRGRLIKKEAYFHNAQGTIKKDIYLPMLIPVSTWDFFPDNSRHLLHNEGIDIGPMDMRCFYQRYADLCVAAKSGSSDPDDPQGGWMYKSVKDLDPDKDSEIKIIEIEGDLVAEIGGEEEYFPNVTVTVAQCQSKKKSSQKVIRWRFNKFPHSYIKQYYHRESVHDDYGVGPLTMGRPIQAAASETLNLTLTAAALSALPPLAYDSDDAYYALEGGPTLYPGKSIPSLGDVVPVQVANPSNLSGIYSILLEQYAQLTGITAPRLGQQTNSHTTAYAKQAELQQGTVRTVDFAKSSMQGPMTQWLHLCLEMSKETLKGKEIPIHMKKTDGYVVLNGETTLPENLTIDVYGAAGPAEDQAEKGAKVQSFQLAMGLEPLKRQLNEGKPLNLEALQKEMLKMGGVGDVERYYEASGSVTQGAGQGAPVAGAGQESVSGSSPAALQAILQRSI